MEEEITTIFCLCDDLLKAMDIQEDPQVRIIEILTHRKEREKLVLDIIYSNSKKGISPKEIIKAIYPDNNRLGVFGFFDTTLEKISF